MIYAQGFNCHKAARILKIAYNNAKVILSVFRREGRIKQIPFHLKRLVADFKQDPQNLHMSIDDVNFRELHKIFYPKLNFSVNGRAQNSRS